MRRARLAPRIAAFAAVVLAAAPSAAQSRVRFAEIELVGPLDRAVVDAGAAGETRVESVLAAGESRRLVVPVPARPAQPDPVLRAFARAGGPAHAQAARLVGWRDLDARYDGLPLALRVRALPAAPGARVRAPVAVLALLLAACVVVASVRARPRAALLLGLAFAAGIGALAARRPPDAGRAVEVLDGVAGADLWRRARSAVGALELPARAPAYELRSEPATARIVLTVPADAARPPRAEAPGAHLTALWAEPWPADALTESANRLEALDPVWVREEGRWTARAPWPLEAALPAPVAGSPPPGWLLSALPQGGRVLIGGSAGARWVRMTWP